MNEWKIIAQIKRSSYFTEEVQKYNKPIEGEGISTKRKNKENESN
jgi:hypothetical protein